MKHINLNTIEKFFDAYSRYDISDIQQIVSVNVKWTFPGQNQLSGIKTGIEEVVSLFDKMGSIMVKSNVEVESLVMGVNDDYVLLVDETESF